MSGVNDKAKIVIIHVPNEELLWNKPKLMPLFATGTKFRKSVTTIRRGGYQILSITIHFVSWSSAKVAMTSIKL